MKGTSLKLRIGYMIVLNGLHHLEHKNYTKYLLETALDHLIIVEGAVDATKGSASWSGKIPESFQNNGRSIDGTFEYLQNMKTEYPNLHVITCEGFWSGKDAMINAAVEKTKEITKECFLWEIDSDEQWTKWKMDEIEREMIAEGADCVDVMFHHMMGPNLIAYGPNWGGNTCIRLWNWKGQSYKRHAPPILEGGNGKTINVHQRFIHYSYYFLKDIQFKSDWYYKDLSIINRWKALQQNNNLPISIGEILPIYKNYDSFIYKMPNKIIEFKWTRWLDVDENDSDVLKNIDILKIPNDDINNEYNFSTLFNIGRQLFKYRDDEIVLCNYDKLHNYQIQIIKNGIDNLGMDHIVKIDNTYSENFDLVFINGDYIKSDDIENSLKYRKDSGYIYISNYDKNENTIKLLIAEYFKNEEFKEFFYIPCHNGACLIL